MQVDITELLLVFDELMPSTDEERGIYWFRAERADGLIIILIFSIHEDSVGVVVKNLDKVDIAGLDLEFCSEIKVLDTHRKCLEILHRNGTGRCFLSLTGSSILEYQDLQVTSQ